MEDVIDLIANALETTVEIVDAGDRELVEGGLDPDDFVLYQHPGPRYPHILDPCKLAALEWESTPVEDSNVPTVDECLRNGRRGSAFDPGREAEERLIQRLAG